jgi:hypothetical protein
MSEFFDPQEIRKFSSRLKPLLYKSAAIGVGTGQVDFDKVWFSPDSRATYVQILVGCLRNFIDVSDSENWVLLSTDTLSSVFGIIPAVSLAAHELGTHLAVWKEAADIKWGSSKLFGPTDKALKCCVLQDALSGGTTILKMESDLALTKWTVSAYLSMVVATRSLDAIKEYIRQLGQNLHQGTPIAFAYILQTSELQEAS